MKKLGFLLVVFLLAIIICACPPLLEDDPDTLLAGELISFEEPFELDVYKWFEILDSIAKNRKYVSLDLSNAILPKDINPAGGLIKFTVSDVSASETYTAFDPFPAASSGKSYILSIILPEEAQMIIQAVEDDAIPEEDNDDEMENAKKYSAFRSFTGLRSVTAKNVTLIGNFAFADCTTLRTVDFPRVGHAVTDAELLDSDNTMANGYRIDIGRHAFAGCTGLKEVKFNWAAVIGENAFAGCTELSKIDFPNVWNIEKKAFKGCKKLVNVFFEQASKIGEEAFKDCTELVKAEFNVKPTPGSTPIFPSPDEDIDPIYESVIFYPSAFSGCKKLEVLNAKRAWNVYFAKNVFASTGTTLDIYLLDEPTTTGYSYGHPQNAMLLGDTATVTTLKTVNIYVPSDGELIYENKAPDNIEVWLKTKYPTPITQVTSYRKN